MTTLAFWIVLALSALAGFAGYRWVRRDPQMRGLGAWIGFAGFTVAGLIVFFTISWAAFSLSEVYLGYLKLENIGFGARWTQEFGYKFWLFIVGFIITFVVMFGGTSLLKRSIRYGELPPAVDSQWYYYDVAMTWLGVILTVLWSIRMGLYASRQWETVALRFNQVDFPNVDPIYGLNTAFYAFTLPFRSELMSWVFVLTVGFAALTGITLAYMTARANASHVLSSARQLITSQVKLFIGIMLFQWAITAWNHRYWFLINGSNPDHLQGASILDVKTKMPSYAILATALGIAAIMFIFASFFRPRQRPSQGTGARRPSNATTTVSSNVTGADLGAGLGVILVVLSLLVLLIWPWAYSGLVIGNNAQALESPYIGYQLTGTRAAYNVPTATSQYTPTATVSPANLQAQDAVLSQTRIQDWEVFKASNSSRQFSKRQFGFLDADVVHVGNESYVASLRELDPVQLATIGDWLNTHLVYTHGDGHVVARINSLAPDGSANYVVSLTPPFDTPELKVQRKGIYFGEGSLNWVVVNTTTAENSVGAATETYSGTTGLVVGSGFRRLVLAMALDDWNFWRSPQITATSRLLMDRDPRSRVKLIAPFLATDPDVLPTFGGDQYNIIVDGLTTNASVPYSDYFTLQYGLENGQAKAPITYDWIRYVRASVKGVVNAYDGTTDLYLVDPSDPVALTWANIFPGIFRPAAEMPTIVQQQLRYPESMFKLQTAALGEYHVTEPNIFWTGEDKWSVDVENYGASENTINIEPRYMMLSGTDVRDFVLSQPMTYAPKTNQAGSPNMAAWISVGSELSNYGRFTVLKMASDINVPGVLQLENDLNSTPAISQDIAFFNRGASKIYWGNMISYPLQTASGPTMLYAKPLFTQGTQGAAIPKLARVYIIVNRVVYSGETLEQALRNLYAGRAISRVADAPTDGAAPAEPVPAQPAGPATAPISGTVSISGTLDVQGLPPDFVRALQDLINAQRRAQGGR